MSEFSTLVTTIDENNNTTQQKQVITVTTINPISSAVVVNQTNNYHTVQATTPTSSETVNADSTALAESINKDVVVITTPEYEDLFEVTSTTGVIIRKGYSPFYSNTTKTWWEFSDDDKKFVDSGISADTAALQGTLTIGTYQYDGTEDVSIPIYGGNYSSDSNIASQSVLMSLMNDASPVVQNMTLVNNSQSYQMPTADTLDSSTNMTLLSNDVLSLDTIYTMDLSEESSGIDSNITEIGNADIDEEGLKMDTLLTDDGSIAYKLDTNNNELYTLDIQKGEE